MLHLSIGLSLILIVIQTILLALISYLLLLTAAAVRVGVRAAVRATSHLQSKREATPPTQLSCPTFLILIPAHNEEKLLPRLLQSVAALDYPPTSYAAHVVADNCSDQTAAVARQMGATVHERTDTQLRGKGPALQWLLQRIWTSRLPHDAVVILDADSYVSSNFLRVMAEQLAAGKRVIQAYYGVDAPERTRNVALRYAAFAVLHYLRPLGRVVLGGSAGLKGNGMVFAADVLRHHAWSAALTEDIELHMKLLLSGEPVSFAPQATVWAEMPDSAAQAESQHARWESGRLQMARHYVPQLLRAAWRVGRQGEWRRAYLYLDAAIEHTIPPLAICGTLIILSLLAGVGLYFINMRWFEHSALAKALSSANVLVSIALLAGLLVYVFAGLWLVKAPRTVYRSLLAAPIYIVWKSRQYLSLALLLAVNKQRPSWTRTARNST